MCTVTYLPRKDGGYILTSSRDENQDRGIALPPRKYMVGNQSVFYPKDPDKGGTWFATQAEGETLCLLNGALKIHSKNSRHTMSRGLMLLAYFNYLSLEDFISSYDFGPVEPFTLIILKKQNLSVLRWDGLQLLHEQRDPNLPAVWSSVTLYTNEMIQLRELWFQHWLQQHKNFSQEEIMQFHQCGGDGDPSTNIRMHRKGVVQTVSISSVDWRPDAIRLQYEDLIQVKKYNIHVI